MKIVSPWKGSNISVKPGPDRHDPSGKSVFAKKPVQRIHSLSNSRKRLRRVGKATACSQSTTCSRWWARRKRAFAHPTKLRFGSFAKTIYHSDFNLIWVVQSLREKYFAFAVGQISSTSSPRPFPARGALRGRHERGMGCGGRGSVGAQMESQGGFPVSDRPARRRTALQRLGQNSTGSTWSVETLVEVAAYGEVVWSWHPLLMLSQRR